MSEAPKNITEENNCSHHSEDEHHHSHHHHHGDISNLKVLLFAFGLTFIFMLVEFIGGVISGSLALISDAGHMLSDSTSLILAFFAVYLGKRKANRIKTYGYKRLETITAFVNGLTLIMISLLICKEGMERLFEPVPVNSEQLILVAGIGLLVNVLVAFTLFKNSKESLNVRGAFLHVMGDLLGSIGAIIAGIVIKFTNWFYIDSLISFFIAFLIIVSSFALLKETFHLLMQGTPRHIRLEKLESVILSNENVLGVHDLHVWSMNESQTILTGHIIIKEITKAEEIVCNVKNKLKESFKINHATLEVETSSCNHSCY